MSWHWGKMSRDKLPGLHWGSQSAWGPAYGCPWRPSCTMSPETSISLIYMWQQNNWLLKQEIWSWLLSQRQRPIWWRNSILMMENTAVRMVRFLEGARTCIFIKCLLPWSPHMLLPLWINMELAQGGWLIHCSAAWAPANTGWEGFGGRVELVVDWADDERQEKMVLWCFQGPSFSSYTGPWGCICTSYCWEGGGVMTVGECPVEQGQREGRIRGVGRRLW